MLYSEQDDRLQSPLFFDNRICGAGDLVACQQTNSRSMFDLLDHIHLHRTLLRFQPQSQLVCQRSKDRRSGSGGVRIRSPLELEIVLALQTGFIVDRTVQLAGKETRQPCDRFRGRGEASRLLATKFDCWPSARESLVPFRACIKA